MREGFKNPSHGIRPLGAIPPLPIAFFATKKNTDFRPIFNQTPPFQAISVTLVSEPFPKQDKDEVDCRSILRPSLHSFISL